MLQHGPYGMAINWRVVAINSDCIVDNMLQLATNKIFHSKRSVARIVAAH